ncbi:hypothetical protein FRC07_006778, partial [Ceratobasidium sp. 392]
MPKRASTSQRRVIDTPPVASTSASSPLPIISTDMAPTSEVGFALSEPETSRNVMRWRQKTQLANAIPKSIVVDAIDPKNLSPLVVSQRRLASRVMFGPLPYPIETGLARISNESLEPKRWSLYLGSHVVRALLEGTHQHHYVGWIDRFRRQLTNTSVSQSVDVSDLVGRLSSMQDLAAKYLTLWSENSAISIFRTLHAPIYEMRKFVLWDTVFAVAFGTAPLLHYNTAFHELPDERLNVKILEWAYGCPGDMIVLLAKINSRRVSRWIGQEDGNDEEWRESEKRLKEWKPVMDVDQSSNVVARFAIQESWRQAVLIYLYMGMCGVDSGDARVESSIRQIVQLAKTIESGNPFEIHLSMPCLIAGVVARLEPHRSLLRKKIEVSRNENVWCLRGADFVPVLNHLWHGAGAGGRAVNWEDYVTS